ncbi:unnamed protein product [Cylindrotheca closterium]|uniref:Integrase catalytic domain-containing protein n=1 Tax=Cylindrotheca closterium TaxID=2856 RepID=A0AAD2CJH2_9STRA|nr:unnamed protein product [Cylindrotheca closterium]
MPTDGLYEVHPRQASDLDWFECNMAELFDLDPTYVTPVIPPEFEVYESHRRPSVLFSPEAPIDFDIESTPLQDKIIDSSHKSLYSEPRHSSRRKTRSEDGRWNPKDKTEQPSPPPRDPNAYESVPVVEPVYKNPSSAVKLRERDWERLRKHFAWLPKLVIQKTFDSLNVNRGSEGVATDTVYADTPNIEHDHVAAQFYVGISSLVSDVYGVNTDAQFLQTLQDNVQKRGAPNKLVSNRAQAEVSKAVKDYLQWLCIDDWQSEPHRQNQNPAERRYQDIKRLANRILDRTGAPPSLWLLALCYASFVYNHTAVQSLGWLTPIQVLTGITPDISVLLRFAFYEKVYYKTEEPSFPSDLPESIGYMVGIAEHVGHAMTYKILNPETNKILFRSEIRSAASPNDPNKRLDPSDGEELTSPTVIKSKSDNVKSVVYSSDDESDKKDVVVKNKDLIGRTFLMQPNEEGHVHRAKIVELIDKHDDKTTNNPAHLKFRVSINNDQYEDVMAYNEILERLEADEDNPIVWKFKRIVSHQGPLRPDHPSYMGSTYNVTMEWENGEITPEPLSIIGADDPVACAIYARDNNLLDTPGWKRFKNRKRKHEKRKAPNRSELANGLRSLSTRVYVELAEVFINSTAFHCFTMGKSTSLKVVSTTANKAGGSTPKSVSVAKKSGKKRLENASAVDLRQPKDRDPTVNNDSEIRELIASLPPLIDFGLSTHELIAIGYDYNSTKISFGNSIYNQWMIGGPKRSQGLTARSRTSTLIIQLK